MRPYARGNIRNIRETSEKGAEADTAGLQAQATEQATMRPSVERKQLKAPATASVATTEAKRTHKAHWNHHQRLIRQGKTPATDCGPCKSGHTL